MTTRVEALQQRKERQRKTAALWLAGTMALFTLFILAGYLLAQRTSLRLAVSAVPGSWLVYLLVFTAALIFSWVGLEIIFAPRTSLADQLKVYEKAMRRSQGMVEEVQEATNWRERLSDSLSAWLSRKGLAQDFQLILEQAGLPLKVSEFVVLHLTFILLVTLLAFPLLGDWVIVAAVASIAAMAPAGLVNQLKKKHSMAFAEQLPDTLSLVAGGLKAGYSLLQSIEMVSEETGEPMSTELKKVLAEARLGLSLEDALDHMVERTQNINFTWTVMAIKIQRETGGNLAQFLEVIAQTIRERDYLTRQIHVLTAEGRLSAIILFLLPFVLTGLIYLVNRNYLVVLFNTTIGWVMIGVALVMMVAGGWWLKKIVTIEV